MQQVVTPPKMGEQKEASGIVLSSRGDLLTVSRQASQLEVVRNLQKQSAGNGLGCREILGVSPISNTTGPRSAILQGDAGLRSSFSITRPNRREAHQDSVLRPQDDHRTFFDLLPGDELEVVAAQ